MTCMKDLVFCSRMTLTHPMAEIGWFNYSKPQNASTPRIRMLTALLRWEYLQATKYNKQRAVGMQV